jgi:hypothetical protein
MADDRKDARPMTPRRKARALPALWAIRRALDLCGLGHQHDQAEHVANGSRVLRAFACYIEQHEQPPVDPLVSQAQRQATARSKGRGLMARSLKLVLLALGVAVFGGLAVVGLRGVSSTQTTAALCEKSLPASMRLIDCDSSALTALFAGSLEPADDGRMRAAVMVIRKPRIAPAAEPVKHYAIVDVDCSTASESEVLLVRTFDMNDVEQESSQAFEDFLDYWYPPQSANPAMFHSVLNQIVCEKV